MSMYGTRDAALNWALEYGDTLRAAGYVQGKANPCLFYKKANGVAIMVHGDDFVAVGPEAHLIETRKTLEDKYKIKVEKLGCGSDCKSEMRILNKVVRATDSGITLEADPRHAELVIKELDLTTAKVSAVPRSKAEVSRMPGGVKPPTTTTATSTSRNSQARIAVEEEINSVDDARKSVPNDNWDIDAYDEVALEGDQFEEELDAAGARLYRGVAARLNYMAPDRPDIAYAVKEAARNMSSPKVSVSAVEEDR